MAAISKIGGGSQLQVVPVPKELYAAMDKAKKTNQVTMALPAAKEVDVDAAPRARLGRARLPPSRRQRIRRKNRLFQRELRRHRLGRRLALPSYSGFGNKL